MRNIEILNHFTGNLAELEADEQIVRACMDEFDKMLFVYTSKCRLRGYKIGSTSEGTATENLAVMRQVFASETQDHLSETSLV